MRKQLRAKKKTKYNSNLCFWLHQVLLPCVGFLQWQCTGFSQWWLLLLWSTGSRCTGFSSCSAWAPQLVVYGLSCSVAWGIFPNQDQTHAFCVGRQILIHCTTREVLNASFELQLCSLQRTQGEKIVIKEIFTEPTKRAKFIH